MNSPFRVCFQAGACLPVHGSTPDERPLGGTETALVRLAHALHRKGVDVAVLTGHPAPPAAGPPRFVHVSEARHVGAVDVLVAVKDWTVAFAGTPPSGARFFWTGDGFDQYVNFGLGDPRVAAHFRGLLAVSGWHADTLCRASGFPREKATVIGNGVHPPHFTARTRSGRRLVYASAPYRGLELALRIFRGVRTSVPDAELHVFAGLAVYDGARPYDGPERAESERALAAAAAAEGVVVRGNVPPAVLAEEFGSAALLLYPNTVFETCCMTALEAQAAGCVVVTGHNSALPETVRHGGVTVPGETGSPEYVERFVAECVSLLTRHPRRAALSEGGRRAVLGENTWDHVAARFVAAVTGTAAPGLIVTPAD